MHAPRQTSGADRPRLAVAVWAVAGVVVLALLLVAGRYGFHGDEFYFVVTGRHLQVAAPDNPMLVPYLAAGWYALVGGHLWAFRVLPALAVGCVRAARRLIAREFGAARRHQVAAAAAVAMTALTLAVGHLFETTTFDMVTTAAAVWLFIRAMRSEPQRWTPWIAAGVLTGVAMEIKILAAPLLACCLLGVVICGPRSRLLSPRPLGRCRDRAADGGAESGVAGAARLPDASGRSQHCGRWFDVVHSTRRPGAERVAGCGSGGEHRVDRWSDRLVAIGPQGNRRVAGGGIS
jgi:hypothetical protein